MFWEGRPWQASHTGIINISDVSPRISVSGIVVVIHRVSPETSWREQSARIQKALILPSLEDEG
jgi:hypothetical protein